jgi:hypothetical protein
VSRVSRACTRLAALSLTAAWCIAAASCVSEADQPTGPSSFVVVVSEVNGGPPPAADAPLPPNRGDHNETWAFSVEARTVTGELDDSFKGALRVSVVPGAVLNVVGTNGTVGLGRNIQLSGGKGTGIATLTAMYGPARLWVQDLGYYPAPPGTTPQCSDGKDNNGNYAIDYPADPGCAYADDNTEAGGTYASGASQIVNYELPSIVDVQGQASTTPYPNDAIEVNAASPHVLVVTRVSSDGFYVTDLDPAAVASGYNSIFAFNFSTPSDMLPCDVVSYLAGTANDFFGFTELSFPSYELQFFEPGDSCLIPQPALIDPTTLNDPIAMEKIESAFVEIKSGKIDDTNPGDPNSGTYTMMQWTLPQHFGSDPVENNAPSTNASSCDLNGDGAVDYTDPAEGGCATACDDLDADCSEWTAFTARGDIKLKGTYYTVDKATGAMSFPTTIPIQVNLGPASGFDPTQHKYENGAQIGIPLDDVRGTLREFSGGSLNWTIEIRCVDDLVCQEAGCTTATVPVDKACITYRTDDDPNAGSD